MYFDPLFPKASYFVCFSPKLLFYDIGYVQLEWESKNVNETTIMFGTNVSSFCVCVCPIYQIEAINLELVIFWMYFFFCWCSIFLFYFYTNVIRYQTFPLDEGKNGISRMCVCHKGRNCCFWYQFYAEDASSARLVSIAMLRQEEDDKNSSNIMCKLYHVLLYLCQSRMK